MPDSLEKIELKLGTREDFDVKTYRNQVGLTLSLFNHGGTHQIRLGDDLMVNQLEGHPLEGGLDRVYLRNHRGGDIETITICGLLGDCHLGENGAVWTYASQDLEAEVEWLPDPELPVLYRICRVKNVGEQAQVLDWLFGQDLGLASIDALKCNEAYNSQYLDHRILDHDEAGPVVCSRHNLHTQHPWSLHCCLQGAEAATTDGYQFFGANIKVDGIPACTTMERLTNRVRQYEFAYISLQSKQYVLEPMQSCEVVFAGYYLGTHLPVTSANDLGLVEGLIERTLPKVRRSKGQKQQSPFYVNIDLLSVEALSQSELASLFNETWRHVETDDDGELLSFFYGQEAHVVLPMKERILERAHGTILKTGQGVELDENVLSVTCYGCGVFGSQLALGNTSFGRFTSVWRNALNLERSSGIRLFAQVDDQWYQLGFPAAFVMERDRCRWIYKLGGDIFEVIVTAETEQIVYHVRAITGELVPIRMVMELCGDVNEFDRAPQVTWYPHEQCLYVLPGEDSLLKQHYPQACLVMHMQADGLNMGGAELLAGDREPVVVFDVPRSEGFKLRVSGHLDGIEAAKVRMSFSRFIDWSKLLSQFSLHGHTSVDRLADTVQWYAHNAMIHYATPRGLEQYGGAAWGTRDVSQGPVEFLLALGHDQAVRKLLCQLFSHQYMMGRWPQWFMFDGFAEIQQWESHGDVVFWPVKALCDYLTQTTDYTILDEVLAYTDANTGKFKEQRDSLLEHILKTVDHIRQACVTGTSLPSYGDGDWNDSLQPADPTMKTKMVSAWTVGLAYQTLSNLVKVLKPVGRLEDLNNLSQFVKAMRHDFRKYLIHDGVTAGFVLFEEDQVVPLLHPLDIKTGIHYRLLPINRSILSELFTPEEMKSHLALAEQHLRYPDGMHLMDRAPHYGGGSKVNFQRAETAANFGREIGLQYVHAHLRYCEALAKVGRADALLNGLLTVCPAALKETVPNACPRQANLYFSSSDADVMDRYEAEQSMEDLKAGKIGVLGGWRLYSSGPGIFIGLIISHLFGIRRHFGRIVFDPVLPTSMDGVTLRFDWDGKIAYWHYHVKQRSFAPEKIIVNGRDLATIRETDNPYRAGGLSMNLKEFNVLLNQKENRVEIIL